MFAINLSINDAQIIRQLLEDRHDQLLNESRQASRDGEPLVSMVILEQAQHVNDLMDILKMNIEYAQRSE